MAPRLQEQEISRPLAKAQTAPTAGLKWMRMKAERFAVLIAPGDVPAKARGDVKPVFESRRLEKYSHAARFQIRVEGVASLNTACTIGKLF